MRADELPSPVWYAAPELAPLVRSRLHVVRGGVKVLVPGYTSAKSRKLSALGAPLPPMELTAEGATLLAPQCSRRSADASSGDARLLLAKPNATVALKSLSSVLRKELKKLEPGAVVVTVPTTKGRAPMSGVLSTDGLCIRFHASRGREHGPKAACAAVPGRAAVVAWMNATAPSRSVGAEIGVLEGEFSAVLLNALRPAALHLVDMWRGDRLAKTKSAVAAAIDRAELPLDVALFHRARSADALRKLDDIQLDWAYVDGGHDYETVLADLVLLEGRVKPGGILVGDDMRWTPLPYEPGLAYAERSSLDISGAPWPVDAAVESFARLFPRWSVLGVCHNQYVLQKDAVH